MRKISKMLLCSAAASAALTPLLCSASGEAEIKKVKYTTLTFDKPLTTYDPMIRFERQYLLYGAIESQDYVDRKGKYYTVFWRAKDRSPGMVVRFEYLQANTGTKVHVKEVAVDDVRRSNTTDFSVIGAEYDGQLTWPDGTVATPEELREYRAKVRLGESVERHPTVQGGGNVLAWRISLVRDGNVIDSEKSFLWE